MMENLKKKGFLIMQEFIHEWGPTIIAAIAAIAIIAIVKGIKGTVKTQMENTINDFASQAANYDGSDEK